MLFALMNTAKNIFHVSKIFHVLQQNSLCFPCLEKGRTKFHVFPWITKILSTALTCNWLEITMANVIRKGVHLSEGIPLYFLANCQQVCEMWHVTTLEVSLVSKTKVGSTLLTSVRATRNCSLSSLISFQCKFLYGVSFFEFIAGYPSYVTPAISSVFDKQ